MQEVQRTISRKILEKPWLGIYFSNYGASKIQYPVSTASVYFLCPLFNFTLELFLLIIWHVDGYNRFIFTRHFTLYHYKCPFEHSFHSFPLSECPLDIRIEISALHLLDRTLPNPCIIIFLGFTLWSNLKLCFS